MLDSRDLGLPSSNFKFEKLSKEHELLKEKLDKTLKELEEVKKEKEGRKTQATSAGDDSKSSDELKECKEKIYSAILTFVENSRKEFSVPSKM